MHGVGGAWPQRGWFTEECHTAARLAGPGLEAGPASGLGLRRCQGADGELTKRGPAAIGGVAWEQGAGGGTSWLALAMEFDVPLIQSSTVPVELTLDTHR